MMSARDQLNSYIGRIERRLRLGAAVRGAAILASAALAATVILVLIANAFAFASWSVISGRFLLLCALVYAATFAVALPLLRMNRRRAAASAEAAFPDFKQRLVTFAERDAEREPFIELLAADTLNLARSSEPKRLFTGRALLISSGAGLAALAVLVWLIVAAPGFVGYGAALLWRGTGAGLAPFYNINVAPGDASVRRNTDELVTAQTVGFQPAQVHLFARFNSASKWNELPMLPQPGGSGFQFTFAGLPEGVEYYVEAGSVESRHYHLRVVDLPGIKQITVTYNYPSWTGMKPATDPHGGDLRAIEGTTANLAIRTDRPLNNGVLMLDNGQQVQLSGGQNNTYSGSLAIQKDGSYHIAALDQGRPVRLSEDFFIEANKANAPEVAVVRPVHDYRASPIEEVTIGVHADDQFGLSNMALHYSVNGGSEQTVDILQQKGVKQADGSTTIALENLKLVPGDIVSYYATAKDARTDAHTDIYFVQVDPFEREFSQSQQAGGGGGGGMGGQNDISEREKEIIAETWKEQSEKNLSPQAAAESGKFLSEVQSKLRDQAIALAGRLGLRDLNQQNQTFSSFQNDMSAAAQAMDPASKNLGKLEWQKALPNEQKALQHLLQAEATFRQIQVAFGNQAGGAGGGGAGRDLASLFDLELDTQKNQYETQQTAGSSASQRQQAIDDALRKLDALARRQQDLANQQRTNGQSFEQRWEEEMLRRNAQELQQELQQLQQAQQQGQGGSSGQSGGQSSQSANGQSQANSQAQGQSRGQSSNQAQSSGDPRIQRAIDSLREATDALNRASQQQSAADARRAADRLRDASEALGALQSQQDSGRMGQMASQADQLAQQQQEQADQLRRILQQSQQNGAGQGNSEEGEQGLWQQAQQLATNRQKLADGVSQLEQQMRSAAREMAGTQHDAASKLRDALGNLDQSDLETRLQRSADWLRRGYAPDPNSEPQIATDLRRLADGIRSAQQALGPEQTPNNQGSQSALDNLDHLRDQMQSLTRALGSRAGNQNGNANGNPNSNNANGNNGEGGQSAQDGRSGQFGPGQADRYGNRIGGRNGIVDDGWRQGYAPGQWRGGTNDNWYIDTGNNSNAPRGWAGPDTTINTTDPERTFQQTVNTLNQLDQNVQSDPEVDREVKALEAEMQRLDPRRFPGNPALLEQLHGQVLSEVDKLELQLRRKSDDQQSQIRASAPMNVPPGYQDAVADYFRRLSNTSSAPSGK
jgi:hypothetical protein